MPAPAPSMADKDKDKKKLKLILKLPRSTSSSSSSAAAAAAAAAAPAPAARQAPAASSRPVPSSPGAGARTGALHSGRRDGGPLAAPASAPALSARLTRGYGSPPPQQQQQHQPQQQPQQAQQHGGLGWQGMGSGVRTDPGGAAAGLRFAPGSENEHADEDGDGLPTPPKKRKFKTVAESSARSGPASSTGSPDEWAKPQGLPPTAGSTLPPLAKKPALLIRKCEKPGEGLETESPPASSGQASDPLPVKATLEGLLDKLQKKDTYGVFAEPVDPRMVPDYYDVIKKPMDFGTIRKKVSKGTYSALEQFEADIMLICSNAMRYNAPNTVYYKQARAIQDMARKAIPALRQPGSDGERKVPAKSKSSSAAKKSGKKAPIGKSRFDPAGSDYTSGATLASDGDARVASERSGSAGGEDSEAQVGAWGGVSQGGTLDTGGTWIQEELAGTALKPMSMKDGRRPLSTEEYHRSSYKSRKLPAHGQGPVLAAVGGELQQLISVGPQQDYAYARSLACFSANLGPAAWKFAARKIQKVLAPHVSFGPGWVEQPNGFHRSSSVPTGYGQGAFLAKPVVAEQHKPPVQSALTARLSQIAPAGSSGQGLPALSVPLPALSGPSLSGPLLSGTVPFDLVKTAVPVKPVEPAVRLGTSSVPGNYGSSKPQGEPSSRPRDGKVFMPPQGFGTFSMAAPTAMLEKNVVVPQVLSKQLPSSVGADMHRPTFSGDSGAEESKSVSGGFGHFDLSLDAAAVPLKGLTTVFSKDGLIAAPSSTVKSSDDRNSKGGSRSSTQSRSSSSLDGQAGASGMDGVISGPDGSVMQGGIDTGCKEDGQPRSKISAKQSLSQNSDEAGGTALGAGAHQPEDKLIAGSRGPGSWVKLQPGPCMQDQGTSRDRATAVLATGTPGVENGFTGAHVVPLSLLPTIMGVPNGAAPGVDEYALKAWAQAQAQVHAMNLLQQADPKTRAAIQAQLAAGWQPLPVNLQCHYVQQQLNGAPSFVQPAQPNRTYPVTAPNVGSSQLGHTVGSVSQSSDARELPVGSARQANVSQLGYTGNGRLPQPNVSMMVLNNVPQQTGQLVSGRPPDLPRNPDINTPFLGNRSVASQSLPHMQVSNPYSSTPHPSGRNLIPLQQQPPTQNSGNTNATPSQRYAPTHSSSSNSGTSSRPMPPDLNICFQPPQSPTTPKTSPGPRMLVDSQQPDLALQL